MAAFSCGAVQRGRTRAPGRGSRSWAPASRAIVAALAVVELLFSLIRLTPAFAARSTATKAQRMILVSLDGASAAVVEDAVARGVMPHLARIRASGSTARGSVTALPAKTAAGHAALFTGTDASQNGISGNEVPLARGTVLDSISGYTSRALKAEPIWAAAARQGLRVSVLSATQVYPFTPYLEGRRFGRHLGSRLLLLDGYQSNDARGELLTAKDVHLTPAAGWRGPLPDHVGRALNFDVTVGGAHIGALAYDDPGDTARGFDTIYLSADRNTRGGITLKPRSVARDPNAFQSLAVKAKVGELGVPFRLFALSANADEILLYRAPSVVMRASQPRVGRAALKATGGFIGNGASRYYESGNLGPTLWEGGDGTAEGRYLETVRLVTSRFERLAEFGVRRTRWDLLVTYLPFPDEMLHLWLAYLDPSFPGHDPALAGRLRPFVDDGLRIVDGYVGRLADLGGADTVLAVASDHGFTSSDREVALNVALRDTGLLTLGGDGRTDLSRTRAVYFPGNAGYFLVNKVARLQGIVPPEQEGGVLAELRSVLDGLRDPDTGEPLVSEVLSAEKEEALGGGGPSGGDLYVTLAPRYYPSARIRGDLVAETPRRGVHMMDPQRREMQASFTVRGPGVSAGADLGLIRQIDIAPTLCALLGIGPPAQATGQVIEAALAHDGPATMSH